MNNEDLIVEYYTDSDGRLYLPKPRIYLDNESDEFNKSGYNEKIDTLRFLIDKGLSFTEVVMDYCNNQSEYILSTLKPTLISYIQVLKYGEPISGMEVELEDLTYVELTMELECRCAESLSHK